MYKKYQAYWTIVYDNGQLEINLVQKYKVSSLGEMFVAWKRVPLFKH